MEATQGFRLDIGEAAEFELFLGRKVVLYGWRGRYAVVFLIYLKVLLTIKLTAGIINDLLLLFPFICESIHAANEFLKVFLYVAVSAVYKGRWG